MKRPGGDPILTIELKRANGGTKRPRVFRRPPPRFAKSFGFEWRSVFVGVTYFRIDYVQLTREQRRDRLRPDRFR